MIKKYLSVLLLVAIIVAAQGQNAKYVFLFIGDGMGPNQVFTTELFLNAQPNKISDSKLRFSQFPINSSMTTYSADSYVTCSSAAATAMSTGYKTNNGVVGKSPDLSENYESISIKLKKAGYKVGILSSVAIDHATPAGFYAHQNLRSMYYEISMELPNYNIDYFGGGGFHYPTGEKDNKPDAYEHAKSNGYKLVNTKDDINNIKKGDEKVFVMNPVLYPQGEFYWAIDNIEGAMTLADFTQKGIEVLENDKGFFMMVEGGKIDWAAHGNDGATMVHEVLAFNNAVEVAYDYYEKYPDETLIIVTADHETGALNPGINYSMKPELLKYQIVSGQEFERKMVEWRNANNDIEFQSVLDSVQYYFGLADASVGLALSEADSLALEKSYYNEFVAKKEIDPDADYLETNKVASVGETAISILNRKAGMLWGGHDHSSTPVPVRVLGVGQQDFAKYFDNTELPGMIMNVMGVPHAKSNLKK